MDEIDRQIAAFLQIDGRMSNAQLAEKTGLSVSAVSERVRRLSSSGVIHSWRALLNPVPIGLGFCAFVLLDVAYDGEEETGQAIAALPEVQEMHHISGAHSYLLKIRVRDSAAMQALLHTKIKPLAGVQRTESIVVLETVKETTELLVTPSEPTNHPTDSSTRRPK